MKNLNIKPVNHGKTKADRNRYCGPAVISSITGMATGEASRLIRHVSGRKAITGSSVREVTDALEMCGIKSKYQSFGMKLGRSKGPTLAGWLKATVKERNADRVFLIIAGWHWQLVQGRRIVCGILGSPTSVRDKRVKRRARVANVYELHSTGSITTPSEAIKPKRVACGADSDRGKAQRLAKKLGMEISIERSGYGDNVYWIDYEGDFDYSQEGIIDGHCSYAWWEVLGKLQEIEEHQQKKAA
tara:strand:- start:11539 stop:12270 length:732 start_codon:yes stop_codon:yes gene_type:complete